MGLNLDYSEGQTPLEEDEKDGLLVETIATRGELDEFEQQNIEQAMLWYRGRSIKPATILTEKFIKSVHRRMYNNVWRWAGHFRKSDKSIGIEKWKILTELKTLLDDTAYWIQHKTYEPDEIAIRFKHRLVAIHYFPNGNGRHSRLMADIIIEKIFGFGIFSWGTAIPGKQVDSREIYISALREADKGNIAPLINFARS
jgi:Fic-DOC domain mobile mystery protein B